MTIFFSSDTHFGHARIIKYCNRPFQTWWEMDKAITENWNSVVGVDDDVYHLGDFAFYGNKGGYAINAAESLNGRIHLIQGNHDWAHFCGQPTSDRLKARFEWVKPYHEMYVFDEEMDLNQYIILFHYPIAVWNKSHHGSWHLHGHCHGTLPEDDTKARIDVGVDAFNFMPMSYDDVKFCMTKKVFKPIDHHGKG